MIFTPENAELMKLMGMSAGELDIPARYSMFEEVVKYFGNSPAGKQKVLKILGKTPTNDGLESVWRYVRLENEKLEAIKSLDPEVFEDDISDELKQGVLTLEKIKRIEEDMVKREKVEPEPVNPVLTEALARTENKRVIKVQNPDYSTAGVLGFSAIRETLNKVREINQSLEQYA